MDWGTRPHVTCSTRKTRQPPTTHTCNISASNAGGLFTTLLSPFLPRFPAACACLPTPCPPDATPSSHIPHSPSLPLAAPGFGRAASASKVGGGARGGDLTSAKLRARARRFGERCCREAREPRDPRDSVRDSEDDADTRDDPGDPTVPSAPTGCCAGRLSGTRGVCALCAVPCCPRGALFSLALESADVAWLHAVELSGALLLGWTGGAFSVLL